MKIMTIYGTRPEAIKVAPIINAIDADSDLQNTIVTTGQHREMLEQVNSLFGIVPDYDLDIMSAGQTLNQIASRVISGCDRVLSEARPDAVLVQGDTTTVMSASVAAFNQEIPVIHLEAGLRSGDIMSPFPEEGNRKLTTQISALHLAPTSVSRDNLIRERIDPENIVVTGNTVIDALMFITEKTNIRVDLPVLEPLQHAIGLGESGPVILVTAHRRENLGVAMAEIGGALSDLAHKYPNLTIVFPVHRNPKVRETIRPMLTGHPNVHLIEPLTYAEFTRMMSLADIIVTDSGGVQEEAPSLGKPVLVMRENTERPEAVAAGTVRLVGTNRIRLVDEVSLLLDSETAYAKMANAVNPYGDGHAAARSLQAIKWKFCSHNNLEKPGDFLQ